VSEHQLVHVIGGCAVQNRALAPGLQRSPAPQFIGVSDPVEFRDGLSFALLAVRQAERFGHQGDPAGSLALGLDFPACSARRSSDISAKESPEGWRR